MDISKQLNTSKVVNIEIWSEISNDFFNVEILKVLSIVFTIVIKDIFKSHVLNGTENDTVVEIILNTIVIPANFGGSLFLIQRPIGVISIVEELIGVNSEESGQSFENKDQIGNFMVFSDDFNILVRNEKKVLVVVG